MGIGRCPFRTWGSRKTGARMYSDRVGVGPRALAVIIDGALFFLIACCLGIVLSLGSGEDIENTTSGLSLLLNCLWTIAFFAYYILLEGNSGQTLGKKVVKIKVVKEDGSPITMGDSVIRNLLRIVDGLVFYLVGAILVWSNPAKQRLGDKLAKTKVISVGPGSAQDPIDEPPLPRF